MVKSFLKSEKYMFSKVVDGLYNCFSESIKTMSINIKFCPSQKEEVWNVVWKTPLTVETSVHKFTCSKLKTERENVDKRTYSNRYFLRTTCHLWLLTRLGGVHPLSLTGRPGEVRVVGGGLDLKEHRVFNYSWLLVMADVCKNSQGRTSCFL